MDWVLSTEGDRLFQCGLFFFFFFFFLGGGGGGGGSTWTGSEALLFELNLIEKNLFHLLTVSRQVLIFTHY